MASTVTVSSDSLNQSFYSSTICWSGESLSSVDTTKYLLATFSLSLSLSFGYLDSKGLVYLVLHWESMTVPSKASLHVEAILMGIPRHYILNVMERTMLYSGGKKYKL